MDIKQSKTCRSARNVYVKVNFLKVTDIDTIKEVFHADVLVKVRWREPSLDNAKDLSVSDFSKFWNPKIVISNSAPSATCKTWRSVNLAKDGEAFILEKFRVKGVFAENLELHDFPFDVQDLSIVVSSELDDDDVDIIEDNEEVSAVNVLCFVDDTEWTVRDFVYSEPRQFNKEIAETQFKNPALLVKCVATRNAGFFLYNIILIMTMISTLSLTTFAVDKSLIQNRLQLAFIITLTGVTFKMVSNQSLPKIPYLTHLDRFIIGSMVYNWLVCLWHAVLSQYEGKSNQGDMDKIAFFVLIGLLGVFHLVFWLVVLIKRIYQEFKLKDRESVYQEKALRLMGSSWKSERINRRNRITRKNKIDAGGNFV
ncbi:gamma-aminobutyric acid receptor subunit rho-1-like isoform X2 [Ruditapes philippinarum]|uniref:gamma-aminobutyric acid receptor subunit rho-1-like isoform X2 n=1 Tax=Ruditapes philippinarum TaxID=129788 RepID=UPI00295B62A3|nr:gamma-aminobutyric acid receptor subunit rho-1-like isoform X2 [Ruditapes philippinarum]